MQLKSYFIILFLVFSFNHNFAQDLPAKSNRLVNDYAGLLSKQEIGFLERKLVNYNDTTSTQIAVLIIDDLKGYDIVDYAQRVGQAWGVGQKGKENGVIIVLKPKTATSKGEVNIDVGYGLEPIIPDATAKRIVEKEMIPHFQNNDYVGGLNAATDVIISLAAGQFSADEYHNRGGGRIGFIVPILILIIIFSIINRSRRGQYSAGRSSLPFWTALWLGSTMGRSHGGSWSNFHSGSGGFGSGGGGFGGFGGGSFGGGGASGSW